MTIGQKYVVTLHEDGSGTAVIDQIDFTGSFSYNNVYTSNVVVLFNDIADTINDSYIVTYYWADGEGPNLTSATIADILSDAIIQVNTVLPGSIVI